jgi:hypothetical protein
VVKKLVNQKYGDNAAHAIKAKTLRKLISNNIWYAPGDTGLFGVPGNNGGFLHKISLK